MISRTAGCRVFSGLVSLGPEERNGMFACVFQSRILLCLFLMTIWTVPAVTGCPAQSHGLEETTGSDPFPHKARIRYAQGFTIEYHPTHKRLQVLSPWRDARVTFSYILLPRGQKPPAVVFDRYDHRGAGRTPRPGQHLQPCLLRHASPGRVLGWDCPLPSCLHPENRGADPPGAHC